MSVINFPYNRPRPNDNDVPIAVSGSLGIENYKVRLDPLGEYIKHIDCWGKFLAVDKILLRNSLILNGKVYVPQTGSQYDDEAIAVYQEALPGYEIIGIMENYNTPQF